MDPEGGESPMAAAADLSVVGGNLEGLAFAATFMGIAALSMFALSVARDYEKGTIRLLLVGQPRRAVLLGGKLLALIAVAIVGVAVATAGAVGLSFVLAPIYEVNTALWATAAGWSAVWSTLANLAIATSITAGLAYLMIGESLIGIVWDTAGQWLPSGILSAFTTGGTALVSYSKSAWLLVAYAATSLAILFVVMQRRDVTD